MFNLYKTELPYSNSSPKSKNKFPKSTKNKNKKIQINNLLSRKDLNKKIINSSLNRKLLSENYLDFLIKEKLIYADIDKIAAHYSKKIDEYKQRYDENQNIINQKRKELQDLNMELYKNIVNHMQFENTENFDERPDQEIEKTKKEIKAKEHQIEVFKDIYNQSYKLNLNLSNKFSLEQNYGKIYEDQYIKYNNIYQNSINKIQKQEEKLNVLNGYFNKFKIINNSLILNQVEKLNRLEYEIVMIKNDVVDFEENFARIQQKNEQFQKILESAKHEYKMRKYDFNSIEKTFLKEYYKMFEIYEIFKVEDIDNILKQFIIIKQKFNDLSLKFNKHSNENMHLRMKLTRLEKKLTEIKNKTIEKKEQAKIDSEKSDKDLMEIINLQKNEFNILNMEMVNSCINKENLISFALNNLIALNIKIITSLNNSYNKSPLLSKTKLVISRKSKLFESYNIKSIGIMKEKNLILLIANLFKTTTTKIYEIIQNVLYNIYILINIKEEEQKNEEESITEQKFNIIQCNSERVKKMMDSQLKIIREKLRVKKQIYSRNSEQLLTNPKNNNSPLNKKVRHSFSSDNIFNINEKKISIKKYQMISPQDLLSEFSNYNDNNLMASLDYSGINKKLFIEEYSNELVAESDKEKMKDERTQKIKQSSRLIKNRLEEKELRNYLKKKTNIKRIIKLRKNIKNKKSDEQGEEELKEYENELIALKKELREKQKPKKFKIKLANPENNLISNRYEDIRMLEFNYFKHYSDYRVEQNIFNEYFYNVRKKFHENSKGQITSQSLNNSSTNRNVYNKKKLNKNYSIFLPKIDSKGI